MEMIIMHPVYAISHVHARLNACIWMWLCLAVCSKSNTNDLTICKACTLQYMLAKSLQNNCLLARVNLLVLPPMQKP